MIPNCNMEHRTWPEGLGAMTKCSHILGWKERRYYSAQRSASVPNGTDKLDENGVLWLHQGSTRSKSGLNNSQKMQSHPWLGGTQVLFRAVECRCSQRDRQASTRVKRPGALGPAVRVRKWNRGGLVRPKPGGTKQRVINEKGEMGRHT